MPCVFLQTTTKVLVSRIHTGEQKTLKQREKNVGDRSFGMLSARRSSDGMGDIRFTDTTAESSSVHGNRRTNRNQVGVGGFDSRPWHF